MTLLAVCCRVCPGVLSSITCVKVMLCVTVPCHCVPSAVVFVLVYVSGV